MTTIVATCKRASVDWTLHCEDGKLWAAGSWATELTLRAGPWPVTHYVYAMRQLMIVSRRIKRQMRQPSILKSQPIFEKTTACAGE